jgi:hypothetical protein
MGTSEVGSKMRDLLDCPVLHLFLVFYFDEAVRQNEPAAHVSQVAKAKGPPHLPSGTGFTCKGDGLITISWSFPHHYHASTIPSYEATGSVGHTLLVN